MRRRVAFVSRHRFAIAYVVMAVAMLVGVYRVEQLSRQGQQAHVALCVFRSDLARRTAAGEDFLRTHPQGVAGISPVDMKRALDSQKATLDSLSDLRCP